MNLTQQRKKGRRKQENDCFIMDFVLTYYSEQQMIKESNDKILN